MSLIHPFLDERTDNLDTDRILAEAIPIAKLVLLFGAVAFVPFLLARSAEGTPVAILFVAATSFVVAVGTAIVLLYVISRAILIGTESPGRH